MKPDLRVTAAAACFGAALTVSLLAGVFAGAGHAAQLLLSNTVVARAGSSVYASTILADHPVGYWRLDESGGTLAGDSSGSGNNGSYRGGYVLGVVGVSAGTTAASLDGSSGYVAVSSTSSLNTGDSFTLEAFVKRASSSSSRADTILSKGAGSYWFGFDRDRITLWQHTGGSSPIATANVLSTDTSSYHYYAVTKSGSSVHIYIDGVDRTGSTSTATLTNNREPLDIGQNTSNREFLSGSIDEAAVYPTALSGSRIQAHYNASIAIAPPTPAPVPSGSSVYASTILADHPVGYWRLDESGGTLAGDSSGSGNNGSYRGGYVLGVVGVSAGTTAASLDGSSGYVAVSSTSSLNTGDSFTLEAFVKRASSSSSRADTILSKGAGSYWFGFDRDRITLWQHTGGSSPIATANVLSTDTSSYHYYAVTKSGSSVHIYIDGVDRTGSTSTATLTNNREPLDIGQNTSNREFLSGSIDEAAVYPTALSGSRIQAHYNASIAIAPPTTGVQTSTSTALMPDLTLSFDAVPAYSEFRTYNGGIKCAGDVLGGPNHSLSQMAARNSTIRRDGPYSAKITLQNNDHIDNCIKDGVQIYGPADIRVGAEGWYGWSWRFPTGGIVSHSWNSLMELGVGCGCTHPSYLVLAFQYRNQNLNLEIQTGHKSGPGGSDFNPTPPNGYKATENLLGAAAPSPLTLDVWHDFYMHITSHARENGVLTIWHREAGGSWSKLYSDEPGSGALIQRPPHPTQEWNDRWGAPGENGTIPGTEWLGFYRAAGAATDTYWVDGFRRRQSQAAILAGFPN